MMMRFLAVMLISVFFCGNTKAQVTIGASSQPVAGALLQIRDKETIGTDNVTSTKGLGMPRVELTNPKNLFPMFTSNGSGGYNEGVKATQDIEHMGLVVYHTNNCTLGGSGMYVWNGTDWVRIPKNPTLGVQTAVDFIELPSGRDLRSLTAKTLKINWAPESSTLSWTAGASLFTQVPFTATPLTPASPIADRGEALMTFLPDAMTIAEVNTNPWLTKETKMNYTTTECGLTHSMLLNQTNYALRINNSLVNSRYPAFTLSNTLMAEANTPWYVSGVSDPKSILDTYSPVSPTVVGSKVNQNVAINTPFDFTLKVATTKYYEMDVTFSDASSPKFYNDITVRVQNCAIESEPSLDDWVARLGTAQDVPAANGVAWHRDQNNNIFFSNVFGTTRWMITNLAATSYAATRTSGDGIVTPIAASTVASNTVPRWAYPNSGATATNATEFNKNKRLGARYNWAGATNSRSGGATTINETTTNQATIPRRQGICPANWHIPTDYEWTALENVIINKTATYSSTPDIAPGNTTYFPLNSDLLGAGNSGDRGSVHGKPMLDQCERFGADIAFKGTSNVFLDGGFSVLLTYTNATWIWSQTSSNSTQSIVRRFDEGQNVCKRFAAVRDNMFPVRCVRD